MTDENDITEIHEKTRRLIAVGASAAVNCRPCLEYHVPLALRAGLLESDIRQAIEIGFGVNRGAHAKTSAYIDDIMTNSHPSGAIAECCDADVAQQTGCC